MNKTLEVRYHAGQPELRMSDTGAPEFRGYATAYGFTYPVAGGPDEGGWFETIEPGAGQRTLNARPDVRLLVNHEGLALARTRSGTLLLEEHDRGLFANAPELDIRNPKVQELQSTMDRRDVDEMSYAFRVTRQEWNADFTERRILEYALDVNGSDVSVVTYPANPAAIGQMRAAVNIDELRAAAVNHGASGMSLAMAKAIATQISVRA